MRRKAEWTSQIIHFGGLERYKQDSLGHKKGQIKEGQLHDLRKFLAIAEKGPSWSDRRFDLDLRSTRKSIEIQQN
jgi:hypothetical protein